MSARRSTRPTASPTLSPVVSRPFFLSINPVPLARKNPPQTPFQTHSQKSSQKIPFLKKPYPTNFFFKKKGKPLLTKNMNHRPRPLRALRADHRRENKPAPLARVPLLPRAVHARLHARRAHGLPLHLLLPLLLLSPQRKRNSDLHPHHLDAPARRSPPAQDR